jgi:hypothetical protein
MLISDFIKFIVKGETPYKSRRSISTMLKLLLFLIAMMFMLAAPIFILIDMGLIDNVKSPVQISLEENDSPSSILTLIIMVGVIYPIIEELAFRYSLLFTQKSKIALGTAFILSFIISKDYNFFTHLGINIEEYNFVPQFIVVSIILILVLRNLFEKINTSILHDFINNNVRTITFVSSSLFAIYHLEITHTTEHFILNIVILSPFFLMGYIFSFVRHWLGISYSIILHGSYNTTLMVISLIIN